jgi:hypothetical protein
MLASPCADKSASPRREGKHQAMTMKSFIALAGALLTFSSAAYADCYDVFGCT